MGILLEKYSDILDGDPQTFPKFSGLPPEVVIPQVTLRNSSGSLVVTIGSSRIDFTKTADIQADHQLTEFISQSQEMALRYVGRLSATVCRLAFSLSRTAPEESPALALATHFCQEKWIAAPLNRPAEFEMHALKRFDMSGFDVNSWMRCKTGSPTLTSSPSYPISAVVVDQDINTLAEKAPTTSLDVNAIAKFFAAAPAEMGRILELYFPNEGTDVVPGFAS